MRVILNFIIDHSDDEIVKVGLGCPIDADVKTLIKPFWDCIPVDGKVEMLIRLLA